MNKLYWFEVISIFSDARVHIHQFSKHYVLNIQFLMKFNSSKLSNSIPASLSIYDMNRGWQIDQFKLWLEKYFDKDEYQFTIEHDTQPAGIRIYQVLHGNEGFELKFNLIKDDVFEKQ